MKMYEKEQLGQPLTYIVRLSPTLVVGGEQVHTPEVAGPGGDSYFIPLFPPKEVGLSA